MDELHTSIQELLRRDPELRDALAEVDRTLIRAALARSPMERVQAATAHLRALRGFKHVPSEGS